METPLAKVRVLRGQEKQEVARAVGCHKSHYGNVEAGLAAASPALARRIARHFGNAVTEHQILYPEDYVAEDTSAGEAA